MVVAPSNVRRSSLVRLLREAGTTNGWTVAEAASLSVERFGSSRAAILIADLASHQNAVIFLKMLDELPEAAG